MSLLLVLDSLRSTAPWLQPELRQLATVCLLSNGLCFPLRQLSSTYTLDRLTRFVAAHRYVSAQPWGPPFLSDSWWSTWWCRGVFKGCSTRTVSFSVDAEIPSCGLPPLRFSPAVGPPFLSDSFQSLAPSLQLQPLSVGSAVESPSLSDSLRSLAPLLQLKL